MRLTLALAGLAALAFASTSVADPVTLTPVAYSPAFAHAVTNDIGENEGAYLSADVTRSVSQALARHGATLGSGGLTIELSIVDADPNRITLRQLHRRPDLDIADSVSVGGAELHAIIRGADGQTLSEVSHRRYDYTLADLVGPPTTWTSAERTIDQFADKVADAYDAQTHAQ